MKIAVRGGHCPKVTGAIALLNELTEDRKVKDSVIKYLKQLGHTVLDVTPPDSTSTSDSDLVYGVSKANEWGADLFVSIHFNKAYNSYNGAIGTEAWVYSKSDKFNDETYAQRIVNNIAALGFKNRGVKESQVLYELKNTKMPSIIVEVCFVEATEDVALYKKIGSDKIGQVISEGIANKKVSSNTSGNVTSTPTTNTSTTLYRVKDSKGIQLGAFSKLDNAKSLAQEKKAIVYDTNGKVVVSYVPVVDKSTRYAEKGVFTFNTAVVVRTAPEENAKTNVTYYAGEKVTYTHVILNKNNYNWVEYKRSNGQTGYLKIKDLKTGESYGYAK